MGQYYRPVNLNTMTWLSSHDYNCGLKLMEHSYVGNKFMGAVHKLLQPGQPWHMGRIVWAGDYGEKTVMDFIPTDRKEEVLVAALNASGENVHMSTKDSDHIQPDSLCAEEQEKIYLCNHDKELFIDYKKLGVTEDDWTIDPLPLLTSDGNGKGGGDYHGDAMDLVGTWAGDRISVEDHAPAGFDELTPEFHEN